VESEFFVEPGVVRLFLADVHRRTIATLTADLANESDESKKKDLQKTIARAEGFLRESQARNHYIDVKRELNAGEHRRVFSRLAPDMTVGERLKIKTDEMGLTKVSAYLVGWSFTDPHGRPVPISDSAIDNLKKHIYDAVVAAIDEHEEAEEARQEEERKNHSGRSESEATLGSAEKWDGPSQNS
jgi:hypothetical protein